jgi:cytochrome b6-f complex iron-sulfur subunit
MAVEPARRRLLKWLWGALGLAAAAEAVWITGSFLRPRRRGAGQTSVVVAGPVDDFEAGSVTAFPAGKFYLVRLNDGGFLALHRECTHLGCTVPWSGEDGRFPCPCHASSFDITGQVLSPPATRPLDLLSVRIENGIVKIDTRRRVRRSEFHPSQVVHS